MMIERGRLSDLIPEVLYVSVPELSYLSLFCGTSGAAYESYCFNFVEHVCVLSAGQCWRRIWTELISFCQGKRRNLRPLRKVSGREIRRRQFIIAGLRSWHVLWRGYACSVARAYTEQLGGNCLPYV